MRQHFTDDLSDKDFRFVNGNVSNLPDVDLAIVNHSEKVCLLLELKWFIAPAEFGEVVEKSKAIKKGIRQSLKFKQAFADNHEPLLKKLELIPIIDLNGSCFTELDRICKCSKSESAYNPC